MTVKVAVSYFIGGSLSARDAGILRSAAAIDGAVVDSTGKPLEGLFTHGRAQLRLFAYLDGRERLPTVDAVLAHLGLEHIRHVVEMAGEATHFIGRRSMSYAHRTHYKGAALPEPVDLHGPADHHGAPLFTMGMAHGLSHRPADLNLHLVGRDMNSLPHFEIACDQDEYDDLTRSSPLRYRDIAVQIFSDRQQETVLIWSGEHDAFWREGGQGYTADPEKAGRWSRGDAEKEIRHCDPGKQLSLKRETEVAPAAGAAAPDRQPATAGMEL